MEGDEERTSEEPGEPPFDEQVVEPEGAADPSPPEEEPKERGPDGRLTREAFVRLVSQPTPVASWLSILLIGLFLFQVLARTDVTGLGARLTASFPVFVLVGQGALDSGRVWQDGEFWRLGTAILLHGAWFHILLNWLAFRSIAPLLEALTGWTGLCVVFFLGGLGGSVGSLFASPTGLSVGASGGILALLGALIGIMWADRDHLPEGLGRMMGLRLLMPVLLILGIGYGFNMLSSQMQWGMLMDNAAHVAGCVSGLALSPLLVRSYRKPALPLPVAPLLGIVSVAGLAFSAAGVVYFGTGRGSEVEERLADSLVEVDLAEVGIRMKLPGSWPARKETIDDGVALGSMVRLTVRRAPRPPFVDETGAARSHLEGLKDELEREGYTVDVLEEDDMKRVADRPAARIILRYGSGGRQQDLMRWIVILPEEEQVFLTFYRPVGYGGDARMLALFERIVDTVSIRSPGRK